ncbi:MULTISPECIES: lipocalin family protein [Aliivibrio]|uniref:Outer membrane lipoprotein Blc n=1 Tax=Aliivibrio finisterrensis TaxID=511998 RepID=A0A4Q5KYQ3_9GAMM|nr:MULTISPECIES: lipocalin family protein [Aliivibrio]MDD9177229.1 lipocalin family protein [Aliivibrio sp. A6]RYU51864.1 lipocalin [Aliivibrio finisterrensis]RYU55029.1 lipocalin [Aliivibrio finisterrensis]RYU57666.1 lipocalin [Aliivibrio finisterrensis]RYU66952.1 lipocalin [Aliivibrio finisterrensis]
MIKRITKMGFIGTLLFMLSGCLGMPKGVEPVSGFELNRYLGKWYEVARLNHSFEEGLSKVSAEYSINEDGSVKVINRGYSKEDKEWSQAEGKAKFIGAEDQGYLKVSFFGPFYGSYVVFELDKENYQYAFVSGPDLDYLWLLSRTKEVDQEVIEHFVSMAQSLGFKTNELIFVEQ